MEDKQSINTMVLEYNTYLKLKCTSWFIETNKWTNIHLKKKRFKILSVYSL